MVRTAGHHRPDDYFLVVGEARGQESAAGSGLVQPPPRSVRNSRSGDWWGAHFATGLRAPNPVPADADVHLRLSLPSAPGRRPARPICPEELGLAMGLTLP